MLSGKNFFKRAILHLFMRTFEDTYRHKGLRRQLVEVVRQKGITDERVLDAILHIPRHFFMDSAFDKIAYEDRAFPIGEEQTISQPYTVAYQSQLLDIKPYEKLFDLNKQFTYLKKYPGLKFFYGDGFEGLPTYGPFDKVIVTAAAPFIPPKLVEQIRPGGRMVIPLGEGEVQR